MGIRMLHRRKAHARNQAQADAQSAPSPPRPVPAVAADASTFRGPTGLAATVRRVTAAGIARVPADLATTLRTLRTLRSPRRTFLRRRWADLGRGYLARTLNLLPWSRPFPTVTEVTESASVSERPGSAPRQPLPDRERPGPDATP